MRLPPAIIGIERVERGKRKLRLWLPIFLLWPMGLMILIVSIPVLLGLALLYPLSTTARRFAGGLLAAVIFSCELRGLIISIEKEIRTINIQIM